MKINEVIKKINVDMFVDQKAWVAKQAAQHDSEQAKGLLNLLDMIQDAAEEELGVNCPEQNLNTLIRYLYRDASNYKVYNQTVIPGVLSDDEKQRIWKSLQAGEWFIPQLVGLPAKQYHGTEDDHPYFELQSIEETLDPVDTDISETNLVTAFEKYANMWEQNLPFL